MFIGSHTVSHSVMSKLSFKEQEKEIINSFELLNNITKGLQIKTFCYPYGGFHTFTNETENILINQTTLYFDHDSNSIIKNNTSWAGSEFDGNFLNTYDIISTFSGNTINTAVTVKGISIKYLGTFSSESGKKISFYSVNNGKINWGANTKKDYDIIFATDDDLNQLSGDPNKDIKISIIPITQTQKIQNIKTISQYLKSIGITREGAIGLIGNILGESGADPKAAEKNREIGGLGGIGIVQWTASRRRNLEKAANNNNDKILDLNFQLEYLGKELQESYSKVFNNLKTSKSIEDSFHICSSFFCKHSREYFNTIIQGGFS
jgi:hypothetical protein